ncbi:abortive infection family protein [Sediminispirochaeta bajacaliforniensis]|uniref:abortive infection family protein n=1 Tax=Sediminispirochaeta bajacaliforniensis TaxID=148 RepID=UPI00036C3A0C|nr:abortive infection family protein [Sediminispirochaeta bajacaliforniensis]
MSDLSNKEKRYFEMLFDMGSGYVLDFSNRTFEEFFIDELNVEIYNEKYNYYSGSKANRLRGYWSEESNYNVGRALNALLDHYKFLTETSDFYKDQWNEEVFNRCRGVVERLLSDTPVEDIQVFERITGDEDFDKLSSIIKECIERNEPETGLDRLHTFTVKYIRKLCEKHKIDFDREKPLHNHFGKYVKHIVESGKIQSKMTERILKSSISLLDAFNDVRNNKSFAHDNDLLGYSESLLIFRNVASSIKFIEYIEGESDGKAEDEEAMDWDDF